jgi:hypothetical protein
MDEFNDSIFNQEQHDNPSTAFLAKKQAGLTANVKGLQNALHDNKASAASGELDWNKLLMNAPDQASKMRIRQAKEIYLEEAKWKQWEEAQLVQEGKISEILSKPIHERNKSWYDDLQRNNPVAYWDVKVQAQKRRDKATMGLGWHLKGIK